MTTVTAPRRPDPAILGFLSTADRAPRDPGVRLDVVRLAMAGFACARRYDRLASLFALGDEDTVKALALVAAHALEDALCVFDGHDYDRAIKALAPALGDATFLRLLEVAGDVLDWDGGEAELQYYVDPAWLVLADEVEFEAERRDEMAADWAPRTAPTDRDLRAMARADRRFEPTAAERARAPRDPWA